MPKYRVYLTAIACASVEIEADSPKDALDQACKETDGYADSEFSDWDYEHNEVEDLDADKFVLFNNVECESEEED